MGITEKQQEWIEAYLREELRGAALQDFEAALAGDELFRKELRFQQSLAKAARLEAVREAMAQAKINNLLKNKAAHPKFESVQNSIKAARTKNVKRQRHQKMKRWLLKGAIAACVLLMGFGGRAYLLEKDMDREVLAVNETGTLDGIILHFATHGIYLAEQKPEAKKLRSFNPPPPAMLRKPLSSRKRKTIIKHKLDELEVVYRKKRFDEVYRLTINLEEQFNYYSEELDNYKKEIIKYKLDEIETVYHEKLFDEVYRLTINLEEQFNYYSEELDNYKREIIKHKLDEIETVRTKERFDEALWLFEKLQKLLPNSTSQTKLRYYAANLYAQNEDYGKSIKILRQLVRKKSEIEYDARWLLGLLYLKTNEKVKAKKEFKILVEASEKYKDKAQQKLRKHYLKDLVFPITRSSRLSTLELQGSNLKSYEQFMFTYKSAVPQISRNNEKFLDDVTEYMKANSYHKLVLTGRYMRDEEPTGIYENLGFERAAVVRILLLKRGIDHRRINIESQLVQRDDFTEPVSFRVDKPLIATKTPKKIKQSYLNDLTYSSDANFDVNSAILNDDSFTKRADKIIIYLKKNPKASLLIIGHTDSDEGDAASIDLGERRAQAVRTYFQNLGIKNPIQIDSKGDTEPVAPNDTPQNKRRNRRVVIVINQ